MLISMLHRTVQRHGNQLAMVYGQRRLTYSQLLQRVMAFKDALQEHQVGAASCVALLLPNCPEFVASFFAVAHLRAIALLLNPSFKATELGHCLADSRPQVVITDAFHADFCRRVITDLDVPITVMVVSHLASEQGAPQTSSALAQPLASPAAPDLVSMPRPDSFAGPVVYQYTSGSTGKPKRLCRTQLNLYHQAHNCMATLGITAADRILGFVPLYHAYGLGECLLAATCSGAALILLEPCVKAGTLVEVPFVFRRPEVTHLIYQEQVSILPGVPYLYNVLATTPPDDSIDFSSLRLCISAGSVLSQDIFNKFYHRFGIPIRQLYGCTEAGSVSINLSDDAMAIATFASIGCPMKNVEITIMGTDDRPMPPGEIGEVAIKSETLAQGYCHGSAAENHTFRNGYFFTGDLGEKDENGYLYIRGRKQIFIDTGGHKVDPLEIEIVLRQHNKVKDVVVVGKKQDHAGEVIKAVVVVKTNCDSAELIDYCRQQLAPFKVPKIIEFREQIPRSPLGKILRKELV